MKKVTFNQVLEACSRLSGNRMDVYITCPKHPLQTAHTRKIVTSVLTCSYKPKQDRIINTMISYSKGFKKGSIYVEDTDYIKYF